MIGVRAEAVRSMQGDVNSNRGPPIGVPNGTPRGVSVANHKTQMLHGCYVAPIACGLKIDW